MRESKFSAEVKQLIESNFKTMRDKELAPAINEKFRTSFTPTQIMKFRDHNNLRKYSVKKAGVQKEKAEEKRITVRGAVIVHRCL